jgi:putative chitinase
LELGGKLSADPDLALQPDIAARVMVHGMEGGWFTGKRLSDYLPLSGKAGFDAYTAARRIINGIKLAHNSRRHCPHGHERRLKCTQRH